MPSLMTGNRPERVKRVVVKIRRGLLIPSYHKKRFSLSARKPKQRTGFLSQNPSEPHWLFSLRPPEFFYSAM